MCDSTPPFRHDDLSIAHLWYVAPQALSAATLIEAGCRIMTASERDHNGRMRHAGARHLDFTARALIRLMLERCCGLPAAEW